MLYTAVKVFHVVTVVFMSIPMFNLIVVNERAAMGPFNYPVDRFFENLIGHGARRCFVFQLTVLVTGILLLVLGPGINALWENPVLLAKTLLLFALTGLLSYVHSQLQPRIEGLMAQVKPEAPPPEAVLASLKPIRALRKKLASYCLFILLTIIILGLQIVGFNAGLTAVLMVLAAAFSFRAFKAPVPFGWF